MAKPVKTTINETMTHQDIEDALECAWGLVANAAGGDWSKETPEWRKLAERWRDQYLFRPFPWKK